MDRTQPDPRTITAEISKALFDQSARFRKAVEYQLTGTRERPERVASMNRIAAMLARACNVAMAHLARNPELEDRITRETEVLRRELREDPALLAAVRTHLALLAAVAPKEGAPRVGRLTRDFLGALLQTIRD